MVGHWVSGASKWPEKGVLRAAHPCTTFPEEAGKARFNVATPTYATVTCTRHVQHTYYRIIYKQDPFNSISRGVQGCTSTDFR